MSSFIYLLLLVCILPVTAIIYKDNLDGATATFAPEPVSGNYGQNKPIDFDLKLKLLIDQVNVETGYRLIDRADLEVNIINNVQASSFDIVCNGVTSSASNVAGSLWVADVTQAVRVQGEDGAAKSLHCSWSANVVIANGNGMTGAKPKLVIHNRPIQTTVPAHWRKSVQLTNVGDDDVTIDAEYLQVGRCDNPDTILYLLHAQPAQMTTLTPLLAQLEAQEASDAYGKVCALAPSQLGSGNTKPVFSTNDQCIEIYGTSDCSSGQLASINKLEAKECTTVDGFSGSVLYKPDALGGAGSVTGWPNKDCSGSFVQQLSTSVCVVGGAKLGPCPLNKALTRDALFSLQKAFTEAFYTDVIVPMKGANTEVDYYGFEWNSRWYVHLPKTFPGQFRHSGCSTCFVNPCGAAGLNTETRCAYQPNPAAPQIFSQKLYERALQLGKDDATAQSIATFPCDPAVPANLPQLLGSAGLNDVALCGPGSIHSCNGQCSASSSLGSFIDTFDLDDPSQHTTYDFLQLFFGDDQSFNALSFLGNNGTVGAYVFRSVGKFQPFGFGTAQGYNAAFTLRNLRPEEIAHMNAPHDFPGFATDPALIANAAFLAASSTPFDNAIIPQPNLAQMLATTTIDQRDDASTIYGVAPRHLEIPLARQLYNETNEALRDGSALTYITGELVLLQGDSTLGRYGGDKYTNLIGASPRFAWQPGNDNIEDYRVTGHRVRSLGQTGYHIGGAVDEPDVMAEAMLEQTLVQER
jgi:hypothetical protein